MYRPIGGHHNTDTYYSCDADGRLIEEKLTNSNAIAAGPTPYDDTFTYDLNGNRIQEPINKLEDDSNPTFQATIDYTYNGDDQRLTETRTGISGYAITNTYDANGSLERGAGSAEPGRERFLRTAPVPVPRSGEE